MPACPGVAEICFTARQGVRAAGGWASKPVRAFLCPALWPCSPPFFPQDVDSNGRPPNPESDDLADEPETIRLLLAHYHQSEQARLKRAKARLREEILPALRTHRVANIEAAYSGYGDSGCIDGVQFRDPAGERVERASIPDTLKETLESALYEFLPAGTEINDGAQGTLTLDVPTGKVTIKHQETYTETRDSTREFNV